MEAAAATAITASDAIRVVRFMPARLARPLPERETRASAGCRRPRQANHDSTVANATTYIASAAASRGAAGVLFAGGAEGGEAGEGDGDAGDGGGEPAAPVGGGG